MEISTCHCGKRFIKSKVSQQCFDCDQEDKRRDKLLQEYSKQKLMLHIAHMINTKPL